MVWVDKRCILVTAQNVGSELRTESGGVPGCNQGRGSAGRSNEELLADGAGILALQARCVR
jgi:hypothetical protein